MEKSPEMKAPKKPRPRDESTPLAKAHRRFARAALLIYKHEVQLRRDQLLVETQARAGFLARHLGILARELNRLARRPEFDALDQDPKAALQLLQLFHEKSSSFGSGIAVLSAVDKVTISVPPSFLPVGTSVADEPWMKPMKRTRSVRIVPIRPARDDALVYLLSPIFRTRYLGSLLGAIDLDRDEVIRRESQTATTVLATRRGDAVYPSRPPAFTSEEGWSRLFAGKLQQAFITRAVLAGRRNFVAAVQVPDSSLFLLSLVPEETLLGPAQTRMVTRLLVGLILFFASLAVLVLLFFRSARLFRRSQEAALQEEKLRQLGEAVNLIAHEVKNSLNGLRLGVDIVLRQNQTRPHAEQNRSQTAGALLHELQRLTDFTTELLIFSKGITPRRVPTDLGKLVGTVGELMQATARDLAVELVVTPPERETVVSADPTLLHLVVSNMITNALEAAAGSQRLKDGAASRVEARVERNGGGVVGVRIDDTGDGVPESVRDRLFEPFVTSKPSGVGIGLALSRRIARAHGGDLVLDGAAPCTSFLLELPGEER
jgi:signal transduction histidine kinase